MNTFIGFIRSFIAHSVVRYSIVVMGGSMVSNVLAYLYHLIVGRILGPSAYGELAALLSLFYILNVPSSVVQTMLTKFFSVLKAKQKLGESKALFIVSLLWMFVIAGLGFGIVWMSVEPVAAFLRITSKANFYWLYASFALYLIGIVPLSMLSAYQMFFVQSVVSVIGMTLRLLFAIIAAPFGVTWTLISGVMASVVTLLLNVFPLRFLFSIRTKPISISKQRTIGYSIPALLTTLAVAALYNQDVLLVKHFFTSTDAGIYSSLSVLGKVIFYASSAITFVLFPIISERKELQKGHSKLVATALLCVGGLSSLLTIIYILFPQFIVHMLYGASFDAAVPFVGLFGIFMTFFALDNILFSICLATEKIFAWVFGMTAAACQFVAIWIFHTSIQSVIWVNAIIAAGLFVALLIYYTHVSKKH